MNVIPLPKQASNVVASNVQKEPESKNYIPTKTFQHLIKAVPSTPDCEIEIYARSKYRGKGMDIASDIPDLRDFNDKLASLIVSMRYIRFYNIIKLENIKLIFFQVYGGCCWMVYSEINYFGDKKKFSHAEEYPTPSQLGPNYKNAKSIRKVNCHP